MLTGKLVTDRGAEVAIRYRAGDFKSLEPTEADTYVVSSETGFSPLGSNERFLSQELAIPVPEIRRLADWNRFENQRVTVIALASRRPQSSLRVLLLAPAESSACYAQFATPRFGRPFRDFYYNVAFETFAYAAQAWAAKRIAISHLSACGTFHQDIATCVAEALAHFSDQANTQIESLIFLADTEVLPEHLSGIAGLNAEGGVTTHRPIRTEVEQFEGATLLHLEWNVHAEA